MSCSFWRAGVVSRSMVLLLGAGASGCSKMMDDAKAVGPVAASVVGGAVTISPSAPVVTAGSLLQLKALQDSAGVSKQIQAIWLVKDPAIARISSTGVVTGLTAGVTAIGAEAPDGTFATATLTVTNSGTTPGSSLKPAFITYFGGSADDMARDVATDPQGNIYVAGGTNSANFPTTANAFDRTFNNPLTPAYQDAFIAKLSPTGSLLWSTLLGSSGFDRIYALEVDKQGFVYVAGRAGPSFPVTAGAFQTTFGGGNQGGTYGATDGFVCKFRPDGTRVFCSFFGDADVLAIRDIAVDDLGNIYVGSATSVGTFPGAWFVNAFQKTLRGGHDLVIAKIKADGTKVLWATYLGGSLDEVTTPTVRVDAGYNVYVFSGTSSANIPTPNGFDHTLNGSSDGYVAKIAPDGSRLIWATYLGGSGKELNETHSMALDPATGDVIVAAGTTSSDFPVTTGVIQPKFGGKAASNSSGLGSNYPGDAFITRIAANGSRIVGSTYLGGSAGDGAEGVWVDKAGTVYVSGATYSSNFPITTPSGPNLGSSELFVAKLSSNLAQRLYVARFGGSATDIGRACFVDQSGNFYAVGEVQSAMISLLNALQLSLRGGSDGLIMKMLPG